MAIIIIIMLLLVGLIFINEELNWNYYYIFLRFMNLYRAFHNVLRDYKHL
jgi:hypothetical protein